MEDKCKYCDSPVYGQNEMSEPICRKRFMKGKCSSQKPIVNGGRKVGRNDKCPCGSGKKFKQCCIVLFDEKDK